MDMKIGILLFDGFETLDAMGPVEALGRDNGHHMFYLSMAGGIITSAHGMSVMTEKADHFPKGQTILVPGGMATRQLVNDTSFLAELKALAEEAEWFLTVCTGSVLLAQTGLLDGRKATTNKNAFDWAQSLRTRVDWVRQARWIHDGKYYTSSGVSAGIDMALGFLADRCGQQCAEDWARQMEYCWHSDSYDDPFAKPPIEKKV